MGQTVEEIVAKSWNGIWTIGVRSKEMQLEIIIV